ncbi:hypothetical protein T439DRAFT_325297 [Meredithblackwellia eburnea MCA 4105]
MSLDFPLHDLENELREMMQLVPFFRARDPLFSTQPAFNLKVANDNEVTGTVEHVRLLQDGQQLEEEVESACLEHNRKGGHWKFRYQANTSRSLSHLMLHFQLRNEDSWVNLDLNFRDTYPIVFKKRVSAPVGDHGRRTRVTPTVVARQESSPVEPLLSTRVPPAETSLPSEPISIDAFLRLYPPQQAQTDFSGPPRRRLPRFPGVASSEDETAKKSLATLLRELMTANHLPLLASYLHGAESDLDKLFIHYLWAQGGVAAKVYVKLKGLEESEISNQMNRFGTLATHHRLQHPGVSDEYRDFSLNLNTAQPASEDVEGSLAITFSAPIYRAITSGRGVCYFALVQEQL